MANTFPGRTVDSVNGKRGKVEVTEDYRDVFEQNIASDTWIIPIPAGKIPSVTVLDSTDRKVQGEEDYSVEGQITITFHGAFSGKATLN